MGRFRWFLPMFLLSTFVGTGPVSSVETARTNVVLILIDDLGWLDLGCYGSDFYETPNIDRLASQGIRFTDAYAACCVCSPTRAALMTGKSPARLMLTQWLPGGRWDPEGDRLMDGRYLSALPLEEWTIAESLREAGYATAAIGKWHLGGPPFYLPEHQGFGINVAGNNHGATGAYFFPYQGDWSIPTTGLRARWTTLEAGEPGEYLTDRLTDEALAFVREHRDRPFFLYLAHYAVHTPVQARPEAVARYRSKPPSRGQSNAGYAAMIEHVDVGIGRIMDLLRELDLEGRTLVIFTSDNGGNGKVTAHGPLRGNKGNYYEGGIRVPTIVRWPGRVAPGRVSDVPIISQDFYPTILEALALAPRPHQHADGLSLVPVLDGEGTLGRDDLFWHYPHYITGHPDPAPPMGMVRSGDYKLLEFFEDGRLELYNLRDDLGERHDLTAEEPERAEALRARLAAWRRHVGAEMPRPNPYYKGKETSESARGTPSDEDGPGRSRPAER